jgi:hypothetical protein
MSWFRDEKPKEASEGAEAFAGRAFKPSASVRAATMDGQLTLLDLEGGHYFGLDEVGAAIWEQVRDARTFEQIVDHLENSFEMSRPDLERDAAAFLAQLRERALVVDA